MKRLLLGTCAFLGALTIVVVLAQSRPAQAQYSPSGNLIQRLKPGGANVPAGLEVSAVTLRRPVFGQRMSNWCWAATVSNAWNAQGHYVSQDSIVSAVYGTIANVRSGMPSNVTRLLNGKNMTDAGGVRFQSTVTGVYDFTRRERASIDNSTIATSLARDVPVVYMNKSHAVLVVGMAYDASGVKAVEVFDPWPGVGFRFLTGAEMVPANEGGELMYVATLEVN